MGHSTRSACAWPKPLHFKAALVLWICSAAVIASHAIVVREDFRTVSQRHVVVIGSSTAAGVGATHGLGWPQQLGRMGYRIDSHAISGTTIFDALARGCVFRETCLPFGETKPLLIIHFPSNEIASGHSLETTLAAFRQAADWAEKREMPYLFLSIQPRNVDLEKRSLLRALDRQMKLAYGTLYVSVYDSLATYDGRLKERYTAGDGVHLNDDGHALIAQETHRQILKAAGNVSSLAK